MSLVLTQFRKAILQAFEHDVFNTAKAAAYSGMLMLFPALLVLTTMLAQVQEGPTLMGEIRAVFEQFLPADALDLLQGYILTRRVYSWQLILSATGLSIFAGLGAMLSLMEGFRRAYNLPNESWGFGERRLRAMLLVPIALVPLSVATLVVVFGHQIELWMVENAGGETAFYRALLLAHGALDRLLCSAVLRCCRRFIISAPSAWNIGCGLRRAQWPARFSGSPPRWLSAGM